MKHSVLWCPLSYTSYITKFLFAFNIITDILNIYCFTSLPGHWVYLTSFHHTHCGPWTLATIWKLSKTASCQYLLIIHLSSEHLRGHPVGGADDSQRLLVLFLTLTAEDRKQRGRRRLDQHLSEALKSISQHTCLKGPCSVIKNITACR